MEVSKKAILYESLKSVLTQMEPNHRFRLANGIPSIRSTEKSLPLTIDRLVIDYNVLEINDTKYELLLLRRFPTLPEPPDATDPIEEDEVFNIDIHKGTDLAIYYENIYLDGDVVIGERVPGTKLVTDWREDSLLKRIPYFEWQLTQDNTEEQMQVYHKALESSKRQLKRIEARKKTDLDIQLHFSIWRPGTLKTQRFPNQSVICVAMKQMMAKIFGDRPEGWEIQNLEIKSQYIRWFRTGSLPKVRKVVVQNPTSWGDPSDAWIRESVTTLVHPSSLNFQLTIVRRTLRDLNERENYMEPTQTGYAPPRHEVDVSGWANRLKEVVEDWLRYGKPLGTRATWKNVFDPISYCQYISHHDQVYEIGHK
ncbi:hypothetical protein B9Z55_000201 [Caenorhabditis nigoni]|uniref:Uncharacterized protein n=1 Tax=Caenorhabditis nigoni TaxID=1611254 RepID=A0A2G5VIB2_9PELO|nr:hypothetical protein B9Z55_000201 [Caenorhabditis nigoni]